MLQRSRIIGIIIKEVESNISKNTFLANFRMGPLPALCKKFVDLVEILVSHLYYLWLHDAFTKSESLMA